MAKDNVALLSFVVRGSKTSNARREWLVTPGPATPLALRVRMAVTGRVNPSCFRRLLPCFPCLSPAPGRDSAGDDTATLRCIDERRGRGRWLYRPRVASGPSSVKNKEGAGSGREARLGLLKKVLLTYHSL